METALWRDYLSAAIRYWEPRRLLYNFVLAVVVAAHIVRGWPSSREALHFTDSCGYLCLPSWLMSRIAQLM